MAVKLYGVMLMPGHPDEECLVATFDSEALAIEYVENVRLKSPTRYSSFKKKSLLGGYSDYVVEHFDAFDEVPHNPAP